MTIPIASIEDSATKRILHGNVKDDVNIRETIIANKLKSTQGAISMVLSLLLLNAAVGINIY